MGVVAITAEGAAGRAQPSTDGPAGLGAVAWGAVCGFAAAAVTHGDSTGAVGLDGGITLVGAPHWVNAGLVAGLGLGAGAAAGSAAAIGETKATGAAFHTGSCDGLEAKGAATVGAAVHADT